MPNTMAIYRMDHRRIIQLQPKNKNNEKFRLEKKLNLSFSQLAHLYNLRIAASGLNFILKSEV